MKLFILYQDSSTWKTATGWLSQNDVVVTAAHCVLHGDQHATRVRVHAGYSASASGGSSSSSGSQRSVSRIALPAAWSDAGAERADVAFLQLATPLQGATPFKYDTPPPAGISEEEQQQDRLTVAVGYPADVGARAGSPGGEMYGMQIRRERDAEKAKGNALLVYRGDACGGE